jgi:hypothetical protein
MVYISTNNGSNWNAISVGSGASTFYTFVFSDSNVFAGASGGGVFLSTDNGSSWNAINNGLTEASVLSLAIKEDTLFAGTFSSGVWKRPLSEIISSVDVLPVNLPKHFALDQNYPNPFNPVTQIRYALPQAAQVKLEVYNSLGQKVAEPMNDYQPAGNHVAEFQAGSLPSGIYFYRITAGSYQKIMKMMLMK